jgi:hypothetical protein
MDYKKKHIMEPVTNSSRAITSWNYSTTTAQNLQVDRGNSQQFSHKAYNSKKEYPLGPMENKIQTKKCATASRASQIQ